MVWCGVVWGGRRIMLLHIQLWDDPSVVWQVRYELSLDLNTSNLPREQWDTWDPTLISEVKYYQKEATNSPDKTANKTRLVPASSRRLTGRKYCPDTVLTIFFLSLTTLSLRACSLPPTSSPPSSWSTSSQSTHTWAPSRFPWAGWFSTFVNFVSSTSWSSSPSPVVSGGQYI